MKTEEEQDGTIIEFLLGQKPFQGVWFGDINPNNQKQFWWRMHLREYASQFKTVEPEKGNYTDHFLEWRNRFFDSELNIQEWKTKYSGKRYTTEQLHKNYERAMKESPFKR